MPITDEQAKSLKEQLLKQVDSFPEDKREGIKEYIISMDNEQLEEFLIKNKLLPSSESSEVKSPETSSKGKPGINKECVYCLLANKAMESFAIYEDKDYLAALEIKPLSEGHIVLIPKKHIKETKSLKAKALSLADKVGKHLVKQLGAENFQISTSDELKHAIVNIIPTYKGKELNYKRPQVERKNLQELAIKVGAIKKAEKKPRVKKEKIEPKKESSETKSNLPKYPRRIP
jgi:histidine triad (HIT) family protein